MDFQAKRFKKLISAVVATRRLHMSFWGKVTKCGTVGCAVGNYCLRCPRSGLKLVPCFEGCDFLTPTDGKKHNGFDDWAAVQLHFGLSFDESQQLLSAGKYDKPTKKNVLTRLTDFYTSKTKVGATCASN